jgi:hypothetical protein
MDEHSTNGPGRIVRSAALGLVVALAAARAGAVTGYEVVSDVIAPSTVSSKSRTVTCPEGTFALGGGTTTLDVDGNAVDGETLATIWASAPFAAPAATWTGAAYTTADPSLVAWGLRVDVICGDTPGLETVTAFAPSSSNATKFTQALCPAGKVAIGGGARTSGTISTTQIHESVDSVDAAYGVDPGWAAVARGTAASTWNVQSVALCADDDVEATFVYETTSITTADALAKTTECPEPLVAISGSARTEPVNNATAANGARLTAIGPTGPVHAPTGWFAMVRRGAANDAEWRLAVGVACAAPEPARASLALAAVAVLAIARRGSAA